jgi:hypothetical protein
MDAPNNDRMFRLEQGQVRITENLPGHWIVSWYPDQGREGYPGVTYSSESSDMPAGPMDDVEAWARRQAWATP